MTTMSDIKESLRKAMDDFLRKLDGFEETNYPKLSIDDKDLDPLFNDATHQNHPFVLPTETLKWVAVDLDGTLAKDVWHPGCEETRIGPPLFDNLIKLDRLVESGKKVIIWSSRPWSHFEAVESWLEYYEIPYSRIVLGKLLVSSFIDDRAIHSTEKDWLR